MRYEDPYEPETLPPLEREQRLRLFQQLHQSPDWEDMERFGMWRRSNGHMRCRCCTLPYRDHPLFEERVDYEGNPFDNRLCNGTVVHL